MLVIQGVRIRAAEGHTTVDRARIHPVRSRTSHRLCYIDEQARPSLRERPANRSGNMCDHPFCMVPISCLLALTGRALHREQTSTHAGAAEGRVPTLTISMSIGIYRELSARCLDLLMIKIPARRKLTELIRKERNPETVTVSKY